MTYDDLIRQIAAIATPDTPRPNLDYTRNFVFGLAETLRRLPAGDTVRIPNLGTFEAERRPERPGRNPRTGEAITIPARVKLAFRPATAQRREG